MKEKRPPTSDEIERIRTDLLTAVRCLDHENLAGVWSTCREIMQKVSDMESEVRLMKP